MKKNEEYKTTTNTRVYNLLHKELNAKRCSYCRWHPTFWQSSENERYDQMYYHEKCGEMIKGIYNHYNWKLSTKNRKQWMKKKYNITKKRMHHSGNEFYVVVIF